MLCCVGVAQQAQELESPTFKIEVKVNKVLVPVVVRDAQGHAVGNLKKEDFQIFDQGKSETISGFSVEQRGVAEIGQGSSNPPPATPDAGHPAPSQPQRFIVFLFDDLHLQPENLGQIQQIGNRILPASLSDSDMAAIVTTSGLNSGLSHNRVQLEEAILKLKPQSQYRRATRQCPDIDYYEADLIENKRDGTALENAIQQTITCSHLDPQRMRNVAESMVRSTVSSTLTVGDQDVRVTLAAVKEFVRKMSTLPGERTLILVSPGFLTLTQEAVQWKTEILDLAAQSRVTISAIDARGLFTTGIGASERGPSSQMAMQSGYEEQSRRASMALNEDVMSELADGTGGTFFHNNNDIEAGFKHLTATPEFVYVLELPLDHVKPDGTYHSLKVKVDRAGVHLQTRRGYFAPLPAKDEKAHTKEAGRELLKEPESPKPEVVTSVPATAPASPANAAAAEIKRSDEKLINRSLNWTPPLVDEPPHNLIPSSPCVLSEVLARAGKRANELFDSLQSFSARESIEYENSGHVGYLRDALTGTFDYVVLFQQTPQGTNVQESRNPTHGSKLLPVFTQDVGLPELALTFLPEIQQEYEMKCEGAVDWNGRSAQLVHFVHRKDKPNHTLSFRDSKGTLHPAGVKGRAWIAADSGEVLHMEMTLMDEIPKAKVRHLYLSVNYAPVQFRAQNVRMLLPKTADSYCEFEDHRTIVYHTFTDFMLFSVQTDQAVQKPKDR